MSCLPNLYSYTVVVQRNFSEYFAGVSPRIITQYLWETGRVFFLSSWVFPGQLSVMISGHIFNLLNRTLRYLTCFALSRRNLDKKCFGKFGQCACSYSFALLSMFCDRFPSCSSPAVWYMGKFVPQRGTWWNSCVAVHVANRFYWEKSTDYLEKREVATVLSNAQHNLNARINGRMIHVFILWQTMTRSLNWISQMLSSMTLLLIIAICT